MVNILLGVLKGIGILLAVFLVLLLFLILVVLLGSISYRGSGRYREDKAFSVGVNWLGIVLRVKADYCDGQGLLWGVRLFGILIASNDEEFIRKKEEKRQKKALKDTAQEKKAAEILSDDDDILFLEDDLESTKKAEVDKRMSTTSTKPEPEKTVKEDVKSTTETDAEVKAEATVKEPAVDAELAKVKPAETPQKKKLSVKIKQKLTLIKKKITNLIGKIKAIPAKIKNLIASIKAKINRFLEIKEFFLGEKNREGFLHVLTNLKKMILHILPNKLEGKIEFGVEDPYVMGQILTVLSIFYPVYQDKFTVLPDFENPGFAGDVFLKGRIVPGYLVWRLLVIICNREVRRIYKEGRQLIGGKEA